jgi:hypothetical protein
MCNAGVSAVGEDRLHYYRLCLSEHTYSQGGRINDNVLEPGLSSPIAALYINTPALAPALHSLPLQILHCTFRPLQWQGGEKVELIFTAHSKR